MSIDALAGDSSELTPLAKIRQEIIDAASALLINVEFLEEHSDPGCKDAVDDARDSVRRIMELAERLCGGPGHSDIRDLLHR
jgi:hypothetical protein